MSDPVGLRHFLSSDDITESEQKLIIDRAARLKASRGRHKKSLAGKTLGMIFEKPSTRTRVSFEVAIVELGAHPVVLRSDEMQLGRGEPLGDTGIVLSRYLDGLVVRTFGQDRLEGITETAAIPVINALSDLEHPCQALADVLTIAERFENAAEVKLVYLGDGNNVCHSLLLAAAKHGVGHVVAACPEGFEPIEPLVERAVGIGEETGTKISISNDAGESCEGANVLYTDVWVSMGQEGHADKQRTFVDFQLNETLLNKARPDAIVMHCLPAHRGEEISEEVLDGPSSAAWDQAENRLHTQKALLEWILREPR
jgi:ornithine carbamoyltransferase